MSRIVYKSERKNGVIKVLNESEDDKFLTDPVDVLLADVAIRIQLIGKRT